MIDRRNLLLLTIGISGYFCIVPASKGALGYPKVLAFRNPGCGCCEAWGKHLEGAGFEVEMRDDPDLAGRRRRLKIPEALAGCHLAQIGSYVVDGHVPAKDIIRLLDERPDALGLAVPGMPIGSPGMEGGEAEGYIVHLIGRDGSSRQYSRY
jgi:hypothetical protein